MNKVFSRPKSLKNVQFHFCPGCHHGTIHRLVAEAIDKLNIREETVGVASVGCSVFLYNYFDIDVVESPHGRAAAVATGVKRAMKDKVVFTYQGDGDLAAIGTAEIIHAANRGENFSVIFVNNANYGMTGGQMAPTTVLGQKTATTPLGRDVKLHGHPIKVCELLATLEGVKYLERVSVSKPAYVARAKKAIKRAFQNQIDGKGFSLVEVLSMCPVDWGMDPIEAIKWVDEVMMKTFPLGVVKDI